jgi:endo-1,4-beta-xylanase
MIKPTKNVIVSILLIIGIFSCAKVKKNNNQTKKAQTLSNNFNKDFFIGVALNENQILEKDKRGVSIIKEEFNTISPENCMKWESLQPKSGVFNFNLADKYVAFGKQNNMHIVGHTLVWHSQLPAFMKEVQDSLTMSNHIQKHIETVVKRYKGKVDTWDVVNEALNHDGTLRQSLFLKVIGKTYLEQAFKLAEKYDPTANLVYNDFSLCNPKKREGAVRLVKQLKKSGAKINGIGMQAHWKMDKPSIEEIENSIIAYSELGLKVSFSELDISVLPNPRKLVGAEINQNFDNYVGDKKMNPYPTELPDSVQSILAKRYEDIFKLFLKHKDKIERVTFWGVSDRDSWLNDFPINKRTNYPLLFDRNYQPKKAYNSILALKSTLNK